MNTIQTLSSQSKNFMRNLWYGTLIALLFTSCSGNDNTKSKELDTSLPIYKGNLIGHGGKGSRDLPIYNQEWQLIDYNVGDTAQTMYDAWKLELLDLHGWEQNWYQGEKALHDRGRKKRKYGSHVDYAQPIEDVVITEKIVQYEPVNTTPAK